jgi:flagellar basal body-associated protein FliL
MGKIILILMLIIGLIGGVFFFVNKNKLFITPSKAIYYKANFKRAPNYVKPKYPDVVPNYYKANPRNAPNYVNPTYKPPSNYIKAPTVKPKSKEQATMEAIKSGFKD